MLVLCQTCRLEAVIEGFPLGALHEAFVSRDKAAVGFEAIAQQPPDPVDEKKPSEEPSGAIWIPGYWSWYQDEKEFVWISGVWRIPPPGMSWIPGLWRQFDELGWVWLNGFWSESALDKAVFLQDNPPDAIAEIPGFPESANYFWGQGSWIYQPQEHKYEWLNGTWVPLDPHWVLAPSHYEWRPEGYIYIPAYWDWPLDRRGEIFEAVLIPKISRKQEYTPLEQRKESSIYQYLIVHYPDYSYLCQHIHHYHQERWMAIAPTWWQWHSWWSLPWHNMWALWWWYTHPGYPEPLGLTAEMSEKIRSANPRLIQMSSSTAPLFIVTQKGVVPPETIWTALKQELPKAGGLPILPGNVKVADRIKEAAWKAVSEIKYTPQAEKDVEPSKRGKLYGIREAVTVPNARQPAKEGLPTVAIPSKPVIVDGKLQKGAEVNPETAKSDNVVKPQPVKVDVHLIPVNTLKDMRKPVNKKAAGRPKRIPPPNPSIIHQVMPGPRVGPSVELEDVDHSKQKQSK